MTKKRKSQSTGLPAFVGQQDYRKLKAECLKNKQKFVDLAFPPENSSLFLDAERSSDIIWKRPGDLVSDPKLFVEGASPNDVTQGILGNCWFVSACSALTHNLALLEQVIPDADDQEWDPKNSYCGIFRFRFWRFGKWDLVSDPKLFVEGASPNDVTQGILGNCWFVSACSALTHNLALLEQVIPDADDQEWDPKNSYCGIFRFRFWRFGKWVEIVIDDLLPTKDGKLLFARSKTKNEFWSALLEKAFAKLYGCYENLVGGQLSDALQDVSGGVAETINVRKFLGDDPKDKDERLFKAIQGAFDQHALIVAAIAAKNKEEIEKSLRCGLVKGHAYAVTMVRYIELDAKKKSTLSNLFGTKEDRLPMIRLQNPWGEKEWNGPWSDNDVRWEQVTATQKQELGMTVDEDGEFWMPWEEFVKYFTDISVCQLFNTGCSTAMGVFHEDFETARAVCDDRHPRDESRVQPQVPYPSANESDRDLGLHQCQIRLLASEGRPAWPAEYMLRIYTPKESNPGLLIHDAPPAGLFSCSRMTNVTRLKILEAEFHNPLRDSNLYCQITSEGEKVRTTPQKPSQTVQWNEPFVFHRQTHRQKYLIEICQEGRKKPRTIGKCLLTCLIDNDSRTCVLDIQATDSTIKSNSNLAKTRLGTFRVEISSYDDPMYL
uniref:Calpain catalytic domain-containing protein n=1 Tax=Panagrolaimus sp. JU765 TaxID=591449 RepID=A0AC34RFW6_9BILA